MNVLLRLELLEQAVKMPHHDSGRFQQITRRTSEMNNTADQGFERKVSVGKLVGSDSEQDFLAILSKQRHASALKSSKISVNHSPMIDPLSARP